MAVAKVLRFPRRLPACSISTAQRRVWYHARDKTQKVEEEKFEWYTSATFYSVRLGDVLKDRYRVIGMLGYGAYSTVWLCRDSHGEEYVTVKVSRCDSSEAVREREAYQHLKSVATRHNGAKCVRTLLDTFEIATSAGSHICLVHKPLGLPLSDFQALLPTGRLPQDILKLTLIHVLLALDYLHTDGHLIHTDIQAKNILLGIEDEAVLRNFEEAERVDPSPCKVDGNRIIYSSRGLPVRGSTGRPVLCDFGEARIGDREFDDDIQPYLYRAPEVILEIAWNSKVDIWNLGVLVWDLGQGKHLFNAQGSENKRSNARHLAEMIALLGPPSKSFLQRSKSMEKYFDIHGNLIGGIEIPALSLEELEENLEGENKLLFLRFMRKMLRWVPEERISAAELLEDPWLHSR